MPGTHGTLIFQEAGNWVWACVCRQQAAQGFASPDQAKDNAMNHTSYGFWLVEPIKTGRPVW